MARDITISLQKHSACVIACVYFCQLTENNVTGDFEV